MTLQGKTGKIEMLSATRRQRLVGREKKRKKKKVDDFPSFRYDPPAFEWRMRG